MLVRLRVANAVLCMGRADDRHGCQVAGGAVRGERTWVVIGKDSSGSIMFQAMEAHHSVGFHCWCDGPNPARS